MAPHFDNVSSGNTAAAQPQQQGEYHPAIAGGITSISGVQAVAESAGPIPSGQRLLPEPDRTDSGLPQSRQQAGMLSAGGTYAQSVSNDEMLNGPTPQNTPLIGAVGKPPSDMIGKADTIEQRDDIVAEHKKEEGVHKTATAAWVAAVPAAEPQLPEKAVEKAEKIEHKEDKDREHIVHKAEKKLDKLFKQEEKKLHKLAKKEAKHHHGKPVAAAAAVHHHDAKQDKHVEAKPAEQKKPVEAKKPVEDKKDFQQPQQPIAAAVNDDKAFEKHHSTVEQKPIAAAAPAAPVQEKNAAIPPEPRKLEGNADQKKAFAAGAVGGAAIGATSAGMMSTRQAEPLPAAPIQQQKEGDHAFGREARLADRDQPRSANAVGDNPGQLRAANDKSYGAAAIAPVQKNSYGAPYKKDDAEHPSFVAGGASDTPATGAGVMSTQKVQPLPVAPVAQQKEGDHAFAREARLADRDQPRSANAVGDKPGQLRAANDKTYGAAAIAPVQKDSYGAPYKKDDAERPSFVAGGAGDTAATGAGVMSTQKVQALPAVAPIQQQRGGDVRGAAADKAIPGYVAPYKQDDAEHPSFVAAKGAGMGATSAGVMSEQKVQPLPAAPIAQQKEGDHAFAREARLADRDQPRSANAVSDKPGQQPITMLSSGAIMRHGSGNVDSRQAPLPNTAPLKEDRIVDGSEKKVEHHEPFGMSKDDRVAEKEQTKMATDKPKVAGAAAAAGGFAAVGAERRAPEEAIKEEAKEDKDRQHIVDKEEKKIEKIIEKEEKKLQKLEKKEDKAPVAGAAAGGAMLQKSKDSEEKKQVFQPQEFKKEQQESTVSDQQFGAAAIKKSEQQSPAEVDNLGDQIKQGGAMNFAGREEPHTRLPPMEQRGEFAPAIPPEPRTLPASMTRTLDSKKESDFGGAMQEDRHLRDTQLQSEGGRGFMLGGGFAGYNGGSEQDQDQDKLINDAALTGGAFSDFAQFSAGSAQQHDGGVLSPTSLQRTHEFHAGEPDEHIDEPRSEAVREIHRRRTERGGELKRREFDGERATYDDVPHLDSDGDDEDIQPSRFQGQQQQQRQGSGLAAQQSSSMKLPRQDAGVFEASGKSPLDAKKLLADAPALPGLEEAKPANNDLGAWRGDTIKTVAGDHGHTEESKEHREALRG